MPTPPTTPRNQAQTSTHIAVDLGAESGRVIVGTLTHTPEGKRLAIEPVRRFPHAPVTTPEGLSWDLPHLWEQILLGLTDAQTHCAARGLTPRSIGVDTWGVDSALVSEQGQLLSPPRCYRDPAFNDAFERVTSRVSAPEIYAATGIQTLPINTLYQYHARCHNPARPDLFARGTALLFMSDLFHWLLTGVRSTERTIASTSQMLDVRRGEWNRDLLAGLGLPDAPLLRPSAPGTTLGPITPEIASMTGLPQSTLVVLPPAHDTASAVAAVPATPGPAAPTPDWCFLSSGTWSLLGAELSAPVITPASARYNFTNELGVEGTTRFLKNISGLWLLQRLRAEIAQQSQSQTQSQAQSQTRSDPPSYESLVGLAQAAPPMRTLFPVADPAIGEAPDLHGHIRAFARATSQPEPDSTGAFVRSCLESLAMEYRLTLSRLEETLGTTFSTIHVVGGGCRNRLLNRMIADATGKPVIAGPAEATAVGNLLTQARGMGELDSLADLRAVVARSFETERYEPQSTAPDATTPWDDMFTTYESYDAGTNQPA